MSTAPLPSLTNSPFESEGHSLSASGTVDEAIGRIIAMTTTASEWLDAYAEVLGVEMPSAEERDGILALAGIAAHASERVAAPIACWLAAQAGLGPVDACALAQGLSASD